MSERRYINTALWDDPYVRGLRPVEKLLWVYLLCNPRCPVGGVYDVTPDTMRHHTGLSLRQISETMGKFAAEGRLTYRDNWVILANAPKHQHWKSSVPVAKGIENNLLHAPAWVLSGIRAGTIPYAYPMDRVPIPSPYPPHTPGDGMRSYCTETELNSDSDGAPVENLLSGLADKLTIGTPKGRRS